jgi:hypothetical protein
MGDNEWTDYESSTDSANSYGNSWNEIPNQYAGNTEGWGGADYLDYNPKQQTAEEKWGGPQLTGGGTWGTGAGTNAAADMKLNPWGNSNAATKAAGLDSGRSTSSRVGSSTATKAAARPIAAQIQPLKIGGYTTSTTTNVAPEGPAPAYGDIPAFAAPTWNEREVNRMAQEKAAPGVRKLRTAVQQAQSRSYENPNVGRMTLRDALAGYGLGMEGVMAGAQSSARGEYGQKYQIDYNAQAATYSAQRAAQAAIFQSAWQNYLKQFTTKTSQEENSNYEVLNMTPEQGITRTPLNRVPYSTNQPTSFGSGY